MSTLDDEFVHIGTDNIYKELWINFSENPIHYSSLKPCGGLWLSKKTDSSYGICDWIEYNSTILYEEVFHLFFDDKPGCFIKLKKDAKLLKISDVSDFDKLRKSGYIKNIYDEGVITHGLAYKGTFVPLVYRDLPKEEIYGTHRFKEMLDYDKIAKDYDALYINMKADISFASMGIIKTLIIINPNAILYYIPISIDYSCRKANISQDKKYIEEPTKDYYLLEEYIKENFKDIPFNGNYEEYIENLRKTLLSYQDEVLKAVENMGFKMNSGLTIDKVVYSIIRNLFTESIQKKKILT